MSLNPRDERAEIASVLLVIQGTLFLIAGLAALPFGIVEPWMRLEGFLTLLLAVTTYVLARGVRGQRRWARRPVMVFEVLSLVGSLLLALLPIGAVRGPVPLLTNLALPAVIIILLSRRFRKARTATAATS
jgi:hypothetical protein